MSSNSTKIAKSVELVPQTTAPTLPTVGEIYNDETLGLLTWDGVQWVEVISNAPVNYIRNGQAIGTTGWTTYSNTPGPAPVDGTGGTPNITFTTTDVSPLSDATSFVITKPASTNVQGQGVSYDFTIDNAARTKVLKLQFDYIVNSGTFVAGNPADRTSNGDSDITVWIYDVTNGVVIQPAGGYRLYSSTTVNPDKFTTYFQASANSTSYRLILHNGTSNPVPAWSLKVDNFRVSQTQYVTGTVITDWTNFTPTGAWTSNTTYTGRRRRVGGNEEFDITLTLTGTPNAANLTVNLPVTIDTTKLSNTLNTATTMLGLASITDTGASFYDGVVTTNNTTTSVAVLLKTAGGTYVANAFVTASTPMVFANTDTVQLQFTVPVLGYSASNQMSDASSQRALVFRGSRNATQAITANTTNVAFQVINKDNFSAWNSSTNTLTAPFAGDYTVSTSIWDNGSTGSNFVVFIDGSFHANLFFGNGQPNSGSIVLSDIRAGQTISIRTTGNQTLSSGGNLSITAYPSFSTISATETIAASYFCSTNQSAGTGTPINFDTKIEDTHNSVTTGSSWRFTAPAAGLYNLGGFLMVTTGSGTVYLYKNGSLNRTIGTVGPGYSACPNTDIRLNAGEYIEIRPNATITFIGGALSAVQVCHVSIKRIGI